tara:strand:+ start:66 stop:1022 length:957 start_codon:yes stop_codon:yes gene_type:complete
MAVQQQVTTQLPPPYVQDRQKDLLVTLFGTPDLDPSDPNYIQGLINVPRNIPMQQVAGFTQPQQDAFALAQQGIGAFQPFITQARDTATTAGQALAGATQQFTPTTQRIDQFRDPYQELVTQEALREIDRQGSIAQANLAGQATRAGVFGGSRFGVQQAELDRNIGDIKSRRIAEDRSRNFQQALASAQAAQEAQQRRQLGAGQQLGNLARFQAGIGQLGQGMFGQDLNTLLSIGGQQQQLLQAGLEAQRQNLAAQQQEPFQRISFGTDVLAGLPFGGQTISQIPVTPANPFLQFAGGIGALGTGIGSLLEGFGSLNR